MAQILIIEDNETMREGISQILSRAGHDTRTAGGGLPGLEMFEQSAPDFTITDLKMEDLDGMEVLRRIRLLSPEAGVLVITAFGTIETAVEAMKLGAFDFITKPFSPEMLRLKVRSALEFGKTKDENRYLKAELDRDRPSTISGSSKPVRHLLDQIVRVAPADSTVLIIGESGTGKELVARAIHAQSKRASMPFIKVDCAALAEGVLESELFGHERGSFTGATHRKPGRFELADTGTIFLDEVGEIPLQIQLKLLRVLQDRAFERVGGTRTIRVDVRVLSATNKDLAEEVRAGRFREDLFYRLQVVPLSVPPLRSRREDIAGLIDHFLEKHARKGGRKLSITPDAMAALIAYDWPGNVRELEHLIERLFVLAPDNIIRPEDLPEGLKKINDHVALTLPPPSVPLDEALERLEKQLILRAYEEAGGVKTRTAELLGIKTSALYYKLEKYGIHTKE
jgi:two-component system response regulator HydG